MSAVGIIPARWASSRFPGKALAPIAGRPMIEWVWERARSAKRLRDVIVATDDVRIAAACEGFGAQVVMTSSHHPTATDRIGEIAAELDDAIVVNVQGDEPLIEGFVIDAVVEGLEEDATASVATLVHEADLASVRDPNRVKVVVDRAGRALYFSRAAIPHRDRAADPGPEPAHFLQHVGIYAYRRAFLLELVRLPQTPAELAEQLEQLRVLEHGHRMRAAKIEGWRSVPVDVPGDVDRVEAALRERQRAIDVARRSDLG